MRAPTPSLIGALSPVSLSTARSSPTSAQLFLVWHVRPKVLELHLQFSVLDLGPQIVKAPRRRTCNMLSVGRELPAMARADEFSLARLPANGASHMGTDSGQHL